MRTKKEGYIGYNIVLPKTLHNKIRKQMNKEGFGYHEITSYLIILIKQAIQNK